MNTQDLPGEPRCQAPACAAAPIRYQRPPPMSNRRKKKHRDRQRCPRPEHTHAQPAIHSGFDRLRQREYHGNTKEHRPAPAPWMRGGLNAIPREGRGASPCPPSNQQLGRPRVAFPVLCLHAAKASASAVDSHPRWACCIRSKGFAHGAACRSPPEPGSVRGRTTGAGNAASGGGTRGRARCANPRPADSLSPSVAGWPLQWVGSAAARD